MKNLKITVNGTVYDVQVEEAGASSAPVAAPSAAPAAAAAPKAAAPAPKAAPAAAPAGSETIKSPMPGTIVNVVVAPGQTVKKGDVLMVLEAMKMENEIVSPRDAVIASVSVNKGDSVDSGTPLVSLQ
ncbi:MAG: biotin/lipoyl-binding protein [Clostridiales bacterium]|jgi:biotin carboxyl carrier protein|nr:biotin/lipoyl-binding protein [Clostridiales bacterium]